MQTFQGPDQRLLIARQHQAELIEEAARERLVAGRPSGARRATGRVLSRVRLSGLYLLDRLRRLLPRQEEPCRDRTALQADC
jgi:hypothetical protein